MWEGSHGGGPCGIKQGLLIFKKEKRYMNADKESPVIRERPQLHKRKRITIGRCLRVWAGLGCRAPGGTLLPRETFTPSLCLEGRRSALETWAGRFGRGRLEGSPCEDICVFSGKQEHMSE